MTGRQDMVKRTRIATLLRKGLETKVIVERVGCNKDLVHKVRQELKETHDGHSNRDHRA